MLHGQEKGKNWILTFQKNHMVRKKVRTGFLLFKKTSKGKEKGKNPNLTFQKNHIVRKKVRARSLLLTKNHIVIKR